MNPNLFSADESPGRALTVEQEETNGILCPTCLQHNSPAADFCADCGAPLSAIVTIDPLRSTLAEGFAYRQAIQGQPQVIVLLGVWLIFLPSLLVLPRVWQGIQSWDDLAGTLFAIAHFLISAGIIYQVTANYVRKRRAAPQEPALADDPA